MIKRKGTIVSLGNASGAVPPFAPLKLSAKNIKLVRPTYVSPNSRFVIAFDIDHHLQRDELFEHPF